MAEAFEFPKFHNYPPYFTLQPVADSRAKQISWWKDLILKYCKQCKVHVLSADEDDDSPLFWNKSIQRKLNQEARQTFLGELVSEGRGEWLDKGKTRCLVLWRKVDEWGGVVLAWVRDNALDEGVVTIDEIINGDDTVGTDLHGIDRELLMRVLEHLEGKGAAKVFRGSSSDDEGVKFFVHV